MYGRYGPDDLYIFLIKLYFLLSIINLFINSKILLYLNTIIVIWMFYRFFSKNIYKRNTENIKFLRLKKYVTKPFETIKRNMKDKNHIYKKCYKCKTTLKLPLPYERGIKVAKCPNCGNKIKVLVLRKQKIEIIRKESNERKSKMV